MRLFGIVILLLNLAQVCSQSSTEEAIDRLFEKYTAESPGLSVLVTKGNTVIYKRAFGQANLEYASPISSNTVFNASSLSKQFVAFCIYLLEKEGKLSFNDKVQDFVPEFPQYTKPVEIAHLLSHTSGIRDQWGLLNLAGYRFDDFISNETVLGLISRQKGLNFEPGSQFEYSHSNYTLLAQVIEAATGMPLNEYMKKKVFSPLKMDKTFFLDASDQVVKDRAYSYERVGESYQKVNLNYQNYGPTNLMTTVDDLSKWAASLSNYAIAPKALISAFDAVGELNDGSKLIAADLGKEQILGCKGQFYREYKSMGFYSHGGSLGGFRSFLGRFPEEELSIIILGNENTLRTYSTALVIVDIVFELNDDLEEVGQANNTIVEKKVEEENELSDFEEFTGEYFNEELNTTIQLFGVADQLRLVIGRNGKHDVTYLGTDEFKANSMHEIVMKFLRNEEGAIKGIKVSSLGVKEITFQKVLAVAPDE